MSIESVGDIILLRLEMHEAKNRGDADAAESLQARIDKKKKLADNAATFQGRKFGREWAETNAKQEEISRLLAISELPNIEEHLKFGSNEEECDPTGWLFTQIKGGDDLGWTTQEFLRSTPWHQIWFDTPQFTRGFIEGVRDHLGWLTLENAAELLDMPQFELSAMLSRAEYSPRKFGGEENIMNFELYAILKSESDSDQ